MSKLRWERWIESSKGSRYTGRKSIAGKKNKFARTLALKEEPLQEGKARCVYSDLDLQLGLGLSLSQRPAQLSWGDFSHYFPSCPFLFPQQKQSFLLKQINFFPKGHLKSISWKARSWVSRPTIIRSCFWKPKFELLARKEMLFDLKHKNSNKSSLSPDRQGLSFPLVCDCLR